jgi:uncharacterized protein
LVNRAGWRGAAIRYRMRPDGSTTMESRAFSFDVLARAVDARRRRSGARAEVLVARLRQLRDVYECFGVRRAVLFGSFAAGTPRGDSDVDLLLYGLDEGRYYECKALLEEALRRDVDLHTDGEDPRFVQRAERSGIEVYGT